MKSFDFDLNKPPPNDNNVPEAGPSNPLMRGDQSICLPVIGFELSSMPPGHPTPWPFEAKEMDAFDVVGFRNYDIASVRFHGDLDQEPQGGPTSPLARGHQPVVPVDPSHQPLQSPSSRAIDVQELYDDDDSNEDEGDDDDDDDEDDDGDYNDDEEEEEEDDDDDYDSNDDTNEDNHDDVFDVNGDTYVISSPTTIDHGLERGPTNPMTQVGQPAIHNVPVAPVERSLQPQGSPPHGPIDMLELDSDDESEDNNENEADDDEDMEDDDKDDGGDYNDDEEEEDGGYDDDSNDDTNEDNHDDVVGVNGDTYVISSPTTIDHELERGPTNPMTQVGQPAIHHVPVALVERSLQPQGSLPRGPIDMVELDSDDESEDNNEDGGDNDDDIEDDDEDDGGDYNDEEEEEDDDDDYDDNSNDDTNEDNHDDVVGVNGDTHVIPSPTTIDHELERGPTNPMTQVGQQAIHHVPVAPVERSLQPQGSPPRGPIDMVELDSDDESEDNYEDEGDDNDGIEIDDEDDDGDYNEEDDDYDDDNNDDTNEDNHDDVVDVNGDTYAITSPTIIDHGLERGPTNPMTQVGQPAIHNVPVAPVERSLQPQGSPPHGPIDMLELDSDDESEDNNENEADDDEDDDGDYNDEEEEDDDDDYDDGYSADSYDPGYNDEDVATGDDDVISSPIAYEQASSSQTTQGRTSLINSESLQITDNHQRNIRRRVEPQPGFNVRDFNVDFGGTSNSMPESVAPPPLPHLAPTSSCPTCMRPLEASSSMPNPVAPPPPAPPQPPTIECPICMGPLVEEITTRCGHVFCQGCIKAALSVQAKCPICRHKVAHRELIRLYFNTCN